MSDIVTRLRNWRNVHLARLHILMDEAADEMERLSKMGDCPGRDNAANEDNTPATHATPTEGSAQDGCTLTDADCPNGSRPVAWAVAIGNEGLVLDGIFLRKRDADEAWAWRNEHTEYGARLIPLCAQSPPTLTDAERAAVAWCVEMAMNSATDCVAEINTLRFLLERL